MVNNVTGEASFTLPRVLGLDISTSVTGMTVLDAPLAGALSPRVVIMTHVELARIDGFWAKVDEFKRVLYQLSLSAELHGITHVFVEESLQAFRPGLSSASTLMTLAKFNGIVSSIVRDELGHTPVPLSATSARKTCGIKVSRDARGPDGKKLGAKQQTFNQMTGPGGFLDGHEFPTKRGGAPKDWAYDEVDSAVIAWAGLRSLLRIRTVTSVKPSGVLETLSSRVQFIESVFGPSRSSRDKINVSVRCPRSECASSRDPDKFKLAIRVTDFASHCWVCGFRARSLMPLLIKHASRDAIELYRTRYALSQLVDPPGDHERPPITLPNDFRLLALGSSDDAVSRALDYVRSRGITERDLWRFKLGVSDEPAWRDRVIVPSFDRTGTLNFFTGRAFRRGMVSYKNCDADKTAIVFNELHIDWTQRVVLCEGPFDLFKAGENAVPLLGSNLTEDSALMDALLLHATPIAIALDDDMQEKAQRLGRELTSYGLDVVMVDFAGRHDPGGMTRREFADCLANAQQWTWASALRFRLRRATQASLGL